MNDWKKPGPHNCYEAHDVDRQADLPQSLRDPFRKMKRCPGGSPITAADLEVLGIVAAAKLVASAIDELDRVIEINDSMEDSIDVADSSDEVYATARELRAQYRLLIPIPEAP